MLSGSIERKLSEPLSGSWRVNILLPLTGYSLDRRNSLTDQVDNLADRFRRAAVPASNVHHAGVVRRS